MALLFGQDDRHIGIATAGESLVLAFCPAGAVIRTLHFGGPIDAVGMVAAGIVGPCG